MRREDNYLFSDGDLGAALRANLQRVAPAVDSITKDQFLATPVADLIEHVLGELDREPLRLFEDHMETTERETQVDVSGDQNRYFSPGRLGPFYVPGHEISIDVPFTGEEVFWKLRPSSWKSFFPRADVVPARGGAPGVLRLTFSSPIDNLNEERLGNEIQRELELIRFYVGTSAAEVEHYNAELRGTIERAVSVRKERTQKSEGIVS